MFSHKLYRYPHLKRIPAVSRNRISVASTPLFSVFFAPTSKLSIIVLRRSLVSPSKARLQVLRSVGPHARSRSASGPPLTTLVSRARICHLDIDTTGASLARQSESCRRCVSLKTRLEEKRTGRISRSREGRNSETGTFRGSIRLRLIFLPDLISFFFCPENITMTSF